MPSDKLDRMQPYRAILFDLFNTVALWLPERMPRFTWAGETRPSTLGELRVVLAAHLPALPFADFYHALQAVNVDLTAERTGTLREVPSRERFARALLRAGASASEAAGATADALSFRHMELLAAASTIPPAHAALLRRLRARFRLVLVSNFDHGATARALVARDGVAECFEAMVISDDFGWRKPARSIFEHALKLAGCATEEALFVGDSIEDDVIGAAALGLDVAWVNPRRLALPGSVARPTFAIGAIPELEPLLQTAT